MLQKQSGFTLIELLVAMFLLAIIGSSGFTMLSQMTTARTRIEAQSDRLRDLERTFYYFNEDVTQIVNRPIRTALDSEAPALVKNITGSALLELTRSGWANPAEEVTPTRSSLQRVAWIVEDDKLLRAYWYHLDSTREDPSRRRRMLKGVEEVRLRFLNRDGEWNENWPPVDAGNVEDREPLPGDDMPLAIEISLDLETLGTVTRVFALPG